MSVWIESTTRGRGAELQKISPPDTCAGPQTSVPEASASVRHPPRCHEFFALRVAGQTTRTHEQGVAPGGLHRLPIDQVYGRGEALLLSVLRLDENCSTLIGIEKRHAGGKPPQHGDDDGVDEEDSPGHKAWPLTVDVSPCLGIAFVWATVVILLVGREGSRSEGHVGGNLGIVVIAGLTKGGFHVFWPRWCVKVHAIHGRNSVVVSPMVARRSFASPGSHRATGIPATPETASGSRRGT
mmetsp:Transcript_7175/g.15611  ORF Transcript_7175/g.15611 Transcript_7175/m.15611 type:complete len:240 (-) Transcript_7175:1584-2303(-)